MLVVLNRRMKTHDVRSSINAATFKRLFSHFRVKFSYCLVMIWTKGRIMVRKTINNETLFRQVWNRRSKEGIMVCRVLPNCLPSRQKTASSERWTHLWPHHQHVPDMWTGILLKLNWCGIRISLTCTKPIKLHLNYLDTFVKCCWIA